MKRVKRNVMAILMVVVLLLQGLSVSAYATFPVEAVYDLEKGGTQRFIVMDENGEIGEVVIGNRGYCVY